MSHDETEYAIAVEGEFTADDLTQKYGYCWAAFLREESMLQRSVQARQASRIFLVASVIMYALLLFFMLMQLHAGLEIAAFVLGSLALFMAYLFTADVVAENHDAKQRQRALTICTLLGRGDRTDAMLGHVRLEAGPQGFDFKTDSLTCRSIWDAVHGLFESEGSFGIDTFWDMVTVPKRWFGSNDEIERFRDAVEAWSDESFVEVYVPLTAPEVEETMRLRKRIKHASAAGASDTSSTATATPSDRSGRP